MLYNIGVGSRNFSNNNISMTWVDVIGPHQVAYYGHIRVFYVTNGDFIQLVCMTSSSPSLSSSGSSSDVITEVTWYHNGAEVDRHRTSGHGDDDDDGSDVVGRKLTVNGVSATDSGYYRCSVNAGQFSRRAWIQVTSSASRWTHIGLYICRVDPYRLSVYLYSRAVCQGCRLNLDTSSGRFSNVSLS